MSRKYSQRGYRDEERPGPERPGSDADRRPSREGPRGRGLGAPTSTAFRCRRCNADIDTTEELAFDAVCVGCSTDLHSCTHCTHFDSSARFECRLDIEERIDRKASRNQCELFTPKLSQDFAAESQSRSDAAKAFDDLFDF